MRIMVWKPLLPILLCCYALLITWCPCATTREPLCAAPVLIQRFVHVALQTVAAPPLLGLAWITNKAAMPSERLIWTLYWLAYSRCEPDKPLAIPPYPDQYHNYVYYYWKDHFPATTRCWYRLFVSDAPMYHQNDPNKPDNLLCDQLVLIKRAVCRVTGCVME